MKELKILLRLKPFIKEYKFIIIIGTLGVIIRTILNAPIPYLMGKITDKVLIVNGSRQYFYKISTIVLLLYIASYILSIYVSDGINIVL